MKAVPVSLKQTQAFIDDFHRHHIAAKGDKFRIGVEVDGELVGVAQVGRPISRNLDDGKTLEVVRLCTKGSKNACSFLYSRAARIAKELGYEKIITYILKSEDGTSLKASGWHFEAETKGDRQWSCPSRPRELGVGQMSIFQSKTKKYPTEAKQRWVKKLTNQ